MNVNEIGQIILDLDQNGKPIVPLDSTGKLVLPLDKNGNLVLPLDQNCNPIQIIDGNTGDFVPTSTPDGRNQIQSNPATGKPQLNYDENGKLISAKNKEGDEVIAVDPLNNPIITRDGDGQLLIPKDKDGNPL